jgi:hypothetical protein
VLGNWGTASYGAWSSFYRFRSQRSGIAQTPRFVQMNTGLFLFFSFLSFPFPYFLFLRGEECWGFRFWGFHSFISYPGGCKLSFRVGLVVYISVALYPYMYIMPTEVPSPNRACAKELRAGTCRRTCGSVPQALGFGAPSANRRRYGSPAADFWWRCRSLIKLY